MKDKIKTIREECIKANPIDLGKGVCTVCDRSLCVCEDRTFDPKDGTGNPPRTIRLADVLLAIGKAGGFNYYKIDVNGRMTSSDENKVTHWNLKDDNLAHQKPETIDFILPLVTPSQ